MERRAIDVSGIVQGVGFRPFVFRLATRLGLAGSVKNSAGRVLIEIEGDAHALDRFREELIRTPPVLARIERIQCESRAPRGEGRFRIEPSDASLCSDAAAAEPAQIAPDVATCDECLAELLDPADRRYRYPFLNCTSCGPRLTIVTGAPYDRQRTTMARFDLCAACRAEYDDPHNRRFHAQPTACPDCGPQLVLLGSGGEVITAEDPLGHAADALRRGRIAAIKGLGGYHLACDAGNAAAVSELRRRKQRDEKPFALMVRDVAAAEALCHVSNDERDWLVSPARPIVLLRRRSAIPIAEAVAPGNPRLGIMLPYTPLHHLLLRELRGTLVMTSGNRSDEPIASEDDDALARLAGIADVFLTHDRPIHVRCEDSVVRVLAGSAHDPGAAATHAPRTRGGGVFIRRSRGYAPTAIRLPFECPCPILAVGGQLKGTFALARGRDAFLSHHLGDLDHAAALQAFVKDVSLYEDLFAIRPEVIAHDLHPEYASTQYARGRADFRLAAVQHHHAHLAACMAEHGLAEPVIGVTWDGTGYGSDGAIWGGEFLAGDYADFHRAAHLRYVGLPGGDRAVREPWRMAVAHLFDAGTGCEPFERQLAAPALGVVRRMLERRLNTPPTSSAGRLFDAVAALAGVRHRASFEGQAAMELEWLAERAAPAGSYPFDLCSAGTAAGRLTWEVDTRPLIRGVVADVRRGVDAGSIARRFHSTLAGIMVAVCTRIRDDTSLNRVVLSGGVFMNALLSTQAAGQLTEQGFQVFQHHLVPPNDGGLCLGQLAVAIAQVRAGGESSHAGGRPCA